MQKVTTNKTDRNYDYKTICIHSTDVAIQLRCLVFKNFERIWLMCVLFRRVSKMQSQIVDPSMIGIWQQQMLSTVLDTIDSLSKFITNAKRPAKMWCFLPVSIYYKNLYIYMYSNNMWSGQASKDLDSPRLVAPARRCGVDIPERWKAPAEKHSPHGSMHPPPWQRQQIHFRGSSPEKCESACAIGGTSSKVDPLIVLRFKRVWWGRATEQILKSHAGPFWGQVKVGPKASWFPANPAPRCVINLHGEFAWPCQTHWPL